MIKKADSRMSRMKAFASLVGLTKDDKPQPAEEPDAQTEREMAEGAADDLNGVDNVIHAEPVEGNAVTRFIKKPGTQKAAPVTLEATINVGSDGTATVMVGGHVEPVDKKPKTEDTPPPVVEPEAEADDHDDGTGYQRMRSPKPRRTKRGKAQQEEDGDDEVRETPPEKYRKVKAAKVTRDADDSMSEKAAAPAPEPTPETNAEAQAPADETATEQPTPEDKPAKQESPTVEADSQTKGDAQDTPAPDAGGDAEVKTKAEPDATQPETKDEPAKQATPTETANGKTDDKTKERKKPRGTVTVTKLKGHGGWAMHADLKPNQRLAIDMPDEVLKMLQNR